MEYEYTEDEQAFREEYYIRCGFGNTLFTDLPFVMQPPKIRNEIKAICDEQADRDWSELLGNSVSVGKYIADHSDFYDRLKSADGIKAYKSNKDFCLSRNAYDSAREMQINGMNARIKKMLDQAAALDCNVLMERASDRDSIVVDIYSETVADLNQVLGQLPDQKEDIQKTLRKNSICHVGKHFGLQLDKPEAVSRLESVFDPQKENYQPYIAQEMRSIYPDTGVYKNIDQSYMVDAMEGHQKLSSLVDTLNASSPVAVYENQYGEKVFETIKSNPVYSNLISAYKHPKTNDFSR